MVKWMKGNIKKKFKFFLFFIYDLHFMTKVNMPLWMAALTSIDTFWGW